MKHGIALRFLLGFACLSLLFTACGGSGGGGDDDDDDDGTPVSYSGVHLVGEDVGLPTIWIDKVVKTLSIPDDHLGSAKAVALNGDDVYVAGYHYLSSTSATQIPCVWVNGVRTDLVKGVAVATGVANSVVVSGTKVYVAGMAYDDPPGTNQYIPGYWVLSSGTWTWNALAGNLEGSAKGVAVDSAGMVVFAGERVYSSSVAGQDAFYWDHAGTVKFLDPAADESIEVTGVCAKGTDIVVVGRYSTAGATRQPCYWVNGTETALMNGVDPQFARAVAVNGSSILVAGECEFSEPGIWTEGVWTALPLPDSASGFANAIAVSGSDVYVGGSVDETAGDFHGCFWKNGKRVDISGLDNVYGIAVK